MGKEAELNICFGFVKFEMPLKFKGRCQICCYIQGEKHWSKNVNRSWGTGEVVGGER